MSYLHQRSQISIRLNFQFYVPGRQQIVGRSRSSVSRITCTRLGFAAVPACRRAPPARTPIYVACWCNRHVLREPRADKVTCQIGVKRGSTLFFTQSNEMADNGPLSHFDIRPVRLRQSDSLFPRCEWNLISYQALGRTTESRERDHQNAVERARALPFCRRRRRRHIKAACRR